ncbi:20637_t:CDS:1, partial [Dentiscutata erythropus]
SLTKTSNNIEMDKNKITELSKRKTTSQYSNNFKKIKNDIEPIFMETVPIVLTTKTIIL